MNSLRSTLAAIWRISSPYFRSEDKWAGCGLLLAVVLIELGTVVIDVLLNQWRNRFYNALQERNWDTFTYELIYFSVVVTVFIAIAVYQLYLNQWLQIRWRKWMTEHYLADWLNDAVHYRMQLQGDAADNPDQRITDDVKLFVDRTLGIGLGLLNSVVTLVSFVVILWGLSEAAPLHLFGSALPIPGYLVWFALIYSIIGTWLTHVVGWPLVGLDFRQQQYEADFRFNLVRVRENAEQIALLKGEPAERGRLLGRFGNVVDNWLGIMNRTKKITAFTASYSQASVIVPYVLVAPAYFAGKTQLGGMMQAASAFGSVQGALSFFVTAYRSLAEWQAVINRLEGFTRAVDAARRTSFTGDHISVAASKSGSVGLDDVLVSLPDARPLLSAEAFHIRPGERVLVSGPSGAGKSTLFRAVAGIWPFGRGTIAVPAGARLMTLPQRPYFPVDSLHAALAYPSAPDAFPRPRLQEVLIDVGLPELTARLDEEAHWNRMLSLGEQQRLGIARALLEKPDYLFLDEATASLDEPSEAALYRLLQEKLPQTTVISIGHRATLEAFHTRKVSLGKADGHFTLRGNAEETASA
ncbi:ABC transporter ATP-binding protein/permease [Bradyrhizobium sp. U87765 SZCCT0131]|nr:ABC transporter ATP-binding protein/permease [Bradyrhizobium sp. U87765 SZCCT0131]MBR1260393.1 ABC transporter ATP-binding protein/permease [Bradyrhizobium sp. U87765 SZCCT0134]MBR1307358.1 ABC transporter ATP-binding protein/permease [Bradyrhizobium sp. U87765 SZCCT0110]MBR1321312.1 ABC transporter ATP-binding protein/permease [Bradyrhizobium sp. U87765 SZCCT0109]MBR1349625.1 ABC transporter ATP-binding protein/permease [Bradyrhizobium sp. U87765 SZCCT0048]